MTYQDDFTLPIKYLEQLSEQGTEYLPELIRILVNAAMKIECQNTWEWDGTNGHRSVGDMPTGISRRRCRPEWEISPSTFHKCDNIVCIPELWRKVCGVNRH